MELQREDLTKKSDPDLETRTQEVVKISLLEDLDIRSEYTIGVSTRKGGI